MDINFVIYWSYHTVFVSRKFNKYMKGYKNTIPLLRLYTYGLKPCLATGHLYAIELPFTSAVIA